MLARDNSVDPEIRAALDVFFSVVGEGGLEAIEDLDERRETFENLVRANQELQPPNDRVEYEDRQVPGPEGMPEVRVRIFRPTGSTPATPLPGIFFIHGGGMIMGTIESEASVPTMMTEEIGCVTVSVEYRLAPEHPHPAPVEDCYVGLAWTAANAVELGIDPERLAVYGGSAGGGLAAATALIARDRGGPKLAFQMLAYPMLDDRNISPSSHEITDLGVWDRSANQSGWRHLLGAAAGGDGVSAYAAPARAEDLTGLPPTYIDVGQLDVFRDEDIEYAARLMAAGVPTELYVYPHAVHGSEFFAPESKLGRRIVERRLRALRDAFEV